MLRHPFEVLGYTILITDLFSSLGNIKSICFQDTPFYPFAEKWEIAAPLDSVKSAIVNLKNSDPALFPTQALLQFEIDHTGYYSKVDFFYEDSGEVVRTFLRGRKSGETTLTLVEFEKRDKGETKKMNKDFNYFENRKEIKKFERLIYDKIKEKLDENNNKSRTIVIRYR